MNCTIGKASTAFQHLRPIWSASTVDTKTNYCCTRLYQQRSMLAKHGQLQHGSSTRFHQLCLYRIGCNLGAFKLQMRTFYSKVNVGFYGGTLNAGHIFRLPDYRYSNTTLQWELSKSKRKQGQPCKAWYQTFREDL